MARPSGRAELDDEVVLEVRVVRDGRRLDEHRVHEAVQVEHRGRQPRPAACCVVMTVSGCVSVMKSRLQSKPLPLGRVSVMRPSGFWHGSMTTIRLPSGSRFVSDRSGRPAGAAGCRPASMPVVSPPWMLQLMNTAGRTPFLKAFFSQFFSRIVPGVGDQGLPVVVVGLPLLVLHRPGDDDQVQRLAGGREAVLDDLDAVALGVDVGELLGQLRVVGVERIGRRRHLGAAASSCRGRGRSRRRGCDVGCASAGAAASARTSAAIERTINHLRMKDDLR